MNTIMEDSSIAVELTNVITTGDLVKLRQLLADNPDISTVRIRSTEDENCRSLLHIATDWPGNFPNVADTINLLVSAGANPNAEINGPDTETPLHWAASSNDVAAIDALLDAGANLDAQGAVIAGGDPLEDAIGFQNWSAAKRLVERGAKTILGDEAALGLLDRVKNRFNDAPKPNPENISYSFWNACFAGQLDTAKYLAEKGADINWVPAWCEESPLDGAIKHGNDQLIDWLKSLGAVQANSKNGSKPV